MKTISIFKGACCAAIGLVFISPFTHAQNLFETQIAPPTWSEFLANNLVQFAMK